MRPTFSIICFTVLSGIGYGAWFLAGISLATHPLCFALDESSMSRLPGSLCNLPLTNLVSFLLAFALVATGLLCSLAHLGKPKRAWRALSQWRSSWLSREGIAALVTFVPASLLALTGFLVWTTNHPSWVFAPFWSMFALPLLGICLSAGALITVYCTANIYSSLKTIRAWHDRKVVAAYMLLALYGGLLFATAMARSDFAWMSVRDALCVITVIVAIPCVWLKYRYWRSLDTQPHISTGHAVGLELLGITRPLEAPHTEENYLTREMGFVLARKHSRKLRAIAFGLILFSPIVGFLLGLAIGPAASWLALTGGTLGLFVERWLFFAEARHAVIAYYGR